MTPNIEKQTRGEIVIQLPLWFASRHELPLELKGFVEKETSKAILFNGHALCRPTSTCLRCGRTLTHPISLKVGYGPECSAKLGVPWIASEKEIAEFVKKVEAIKVRQWFPKSIITIKEGELDTVVQEQTEKKSKSNIVGVCPITNIRIELYNNNIEDLPPRRIFLEQEKNKIVVKFPYDETTLKAIKSVPEIKYSNKNKSWSITFSLEAFGNIVKVLQGQDFKVSLSLFDKVKREKEVREKSLILSSASEGHLTIPGLKEELFPFQKAGVEFIELHEGRALIADQMGLGKTAQSLAWLQLHLEKRPAVIICPAFLKYNWAREIEKWLPEDDANTYVILEGSKANPQRANIVIINYDILEGWLSFLINLRPQVIIFDEAHYIKNPKAKRTRYSLQLAKNVPHIIALTGTPLVNRPIELWPIINILRPGQWGTKMDYAKRYCNAYWNGFGWDLNGASNLEELQEKLRRTVMIRRTKEEVLTELPSKQRTPLLIEIDNKKEYEKAEEHFIEWLQEQEFDEEKIRKTLAGQALTKIEYLKQICIRGKIDTAKKWIRDFLDTEQKLVVFAHHQFAIQALYNEFKTVAVKVTGQESNKERDKSVSLFQESKECKLFIGSMGATGVGINLTAASNVLFIELLWTPGVHEQCEDRCHRIGTKNAVNVYYLLGKDTIDEVIYRIIEKKKKILKEALGDMSKNDNDALLSEIVRQYHSKRGKNGG